MAPTECVKSIEGYILIVTGIHPEAQDEEVMDSFEQFGQVRNLHLNLDRRTGYSKGYVLLEFQEYEEAKAAKEAMDGGEILGQTVHVDWAFVKKPSKKD